MRVVILCVPICFIFLGVSLIYAKGSDVSISLQQRSEGYVGVSSDSREVPFFLPRGAKVNRLRLRLTAKEGPMQWEILDPRGDRAWAGSVPKGKSFKEVRKLGLEPGRWTLRIKAESGAGEYRFRRWAR